ncbi:MAG: type II secretion system F family protein [Mariprofundaceae bacterium]
MPEYRYRAIDHAGRAISSVMVAADVAMLESLLEQTGYWLVEAREQRAAGIPMPWRRQGVGRRSLIDFFSLAGVMLGAGIGLVEVLEAAVEESDDPALRRVLDDMFHDVQAGNALHESMRQHPRVFSQHVVALVQAGEERAGLPEVFEALRKHFNWLDTLVKDVKQASIYPAIVLAMVGLFIVLIFSFVVPRFVVMLDSVHMQLPWITRMVIGMGEGMAATWWLWLALFIVTPLAVQYGRRSSERFALAFDHMLLKLPVFGDIHYMIVVSRLSHNLAALYKAGIPIIQSLSLCRQLLGNRVMENALAGVVAAVQEGSSLHEAFNRYDFFPSMLLRMVAVGEATGQLDRVLGRVSDYYDEEIPRRVKRAFAVLEPAIIIFLIGLVGTVALSILLPIMALTGSTG